MTAIMGGRNTWSIQHLLRKLVC